MTGYTTSSHPDYVVVKYAAASGTPLWQGSFGVNGGDYPADMAIDGFGDVFVTGVGIDFIDKYSTIKLRGGDGTLAWQAYDAAANDHSARAIAVDNQGGVYVTGTADPEGNHSNFDDDIFTVKRSAVQRRAAVDAPLRWAVPCTADPSGAPDETPQRESGKAPRKHDDQVDETDDGKATGNPRSAG